MSPYVVAAIVLAAVVALVAIIGWGLLGPRRPSDEAGPHVDLAEQTRQRDEARRAGLDPDGSSRTGEQGD